ncbi:sortase [Patescibacteria group bacterium]|nr:sortase [Patescibacteria group bacterium]
MKDAVVSTRDYDLDKHLVDYGGTAIPPNAGNAVIFGHSTLPQLFNPKNYRAIFATAYKLNIGDKIFVKAAGITYKYVIDNITVVNPTDTSIFNQNVNGSFITLVTCTPPGTTWKRLVIKAQLKKI